MFPESPTRPTSVAVIGAGLAGLTIAHRLRNEGVEVTVFERDPAPFSRTQGFRITADADGFSALERSLTPELYAEVLATSGPPGGRFRFTNERLRDAFVMTFDPSTSSERQVDREVLRRILLSTIADRIRYGRRAVRVQNAQDSATVFFDDDSTFTADVIVVADGIGSALRDAVFPDATPLDTARGGIYGRVALREGGRSLIPEELLDSGFLALLSTPGSAFFFTTMRFTTPPGEVLGSEARAGLTDLDDYVMWGLVLTPEQLASAASESGPADLARTASLHVRDAHPLIRELVGRADPSSVLLARFSAGQRPTHSTSGRIAIMGDALHPMPPFGAHGGNTALRDAATLGDHLLSGGSPHTTIEEAIAGYHQEMFDYGFAAVDAAMSQMNRLSTGGSFQRWVLRRALPAIHRPTVPNGWPVLSRA